MSLKAKYTASEDREPIPAGLHHAICYAVVDLGTQYSEMYDNAKHQILFVWEIKKQRIEVERDGKKEDMPRAISKRYNASVHEKSTLSHDITGWRGTGFSPAEMKDGFDARVMAGENCMLNITHKVGSDGKNRAKVSAIAPLMPEMVATLSENPLVVYDIDENGWEVPAGTPPWTIDVIKESYEYKEAHKDAAPEAEEDQVPF